MVIIKQITENWRFRKYYPEYDEKEKTLTLKGKVPVKTLMEIKFLRLIYKLDIKDIKINK